MGRNCPSSARNPKIETTRRWLHLSPAPEGSVESLLCRFANSLLAILTLGLQSDFPSLVLVSRGQIFRRKPALE